MNLINILQKPIITEKTYKLMEMNKYVFVVHPRAKKTEIKIAFAKIFGVEVLDVNLAKRKPKKKRVGRFLGKTSAVKKAIITIKPGQKLNILQDDENIERNENKNNNFGVFGKFKNLFFTSKSKEKVNPKTPNQKTDEKSKINISKPQDIQDVKEKKE